LQQICCRGSGVVDCDYGVHDKCVPKVTAACTKDRNSERGGGSSHSSIKPPSSPSSSVGDSGHLAPPKGSPFDGSTSPLAGEPVPVTQRTRYGGRSLVSGREMLRILSRREDLGGGGACAAAAKSFPRRSR